MEESVLDKISPIGHFNYYYDGWRNGKIGSISNVNGDCIYRFIEANRDDNGYLYDIHKNIEDNPIIIQGIVGWWLLYRKNPTNRFISEFKDSKIESLAIKEQFDKYTEMRFKQYKDLYRDDPDSLFWDWNYVFYTKYIIPFEMRLNKTTQALFEYISDSDIVLVQKVMSTYIEYLKRCRSEKGFYVCDELKVLRAIEHSDEFLLEDLEDYEINTTLDFLDSKGYIKVAWAEGHTCEDVKMLDKGRVFMKRLETRMKDFPLTNEETPPAIAPQKKNKSSSKKKEKSPEVVSGQHKTFPVISKGDDPYRKAQVFDLYVKMSKKKKENGLELINADLKDFIKCFTEGTTSSTILWNGSKRQLHFIVYEWNFRGHITFGKEDKVWDIASRVFANPKKKLNGKPTFFDADDLRTTRSPKLVCQELEDIVEILNLKNPSPNYDRFAQKAEDRINYGQRVREKKKQSEKTSWDKFMDRAFDDDDDN